MTLRNLAIAASTAVSQSFNYIKLYIFARLYVSFCPYVIRAVARALIGGVYIHIFVLCPTNFFSN